jgi:hypothetical protein
VDLLLGVLLDLLDDVDHELGGSLLAQGPVQILRRGRVAAGRNTNLQAQIL